MAQFIPQPVVAQPDTFVPQPVDPDVFVPQPVEDSEPVDSDTFEQLSYGYDSTPSFVNNMALWMQSRIPLGEAVFDENGFSYKTAEEIYGSDFINAVPEESRVILLEQRQKQIEEEYKDLIASGQTDTAATTIGGFAGAVTVPPTLLPVGQGYKVMTVIGGLLGFGYSAADQLAQTGEVDPVEAGQVAAVTAIATPAVAATLKTVTKAVRGVNAKLTSKKSADPEVQDAASVRMNQINETVAEAVVKGLPENKVAPYVQQKLNLTPDEFASVGVNAQSKFRIPTPDEAKMILEAKAYKKDPVGSRSRFPTIDKLFGALHTRIKNISAPVAGALRKFELDSHMNSELYMRRVTPFIKGFNDLNKKTQQTLSRLLFNGDFKAAKALMRSQNAKLADDFDEVDTVLQSLFNDLKGAGYDVSKVPNYFPRLVKDVDKLREKLTGQQNGLIEAAWKARAKQLNTSVAKLSEEDKIEIVNNIARGYIPKSVGTTSMTFVKGRTIQNVTDDILDDYANPMESLHAYIRQTVHNVEKRKFFGQVGTGAKNNGATSIDLDESIGGIITKQIADKNIAPRDQATLADLLNSRFGFGERTPSSGLQHIRNTSYAVTIGNPISALTQLGDVGVAAYMNGLRNTINAILAPKKIKMQDLGLEDHIAQEFVSTNSTGKFLNKLFTATGFRMIDRFGKNVLLNGSLRKGQAFSKSAKGVEKLRSKYGESFGDEFDLLVNDLRAGKMSDNVKLYLWNELSDVQPISLSEMPQTYLNIPNGRIFYALKSFTLKQLDLIRNDVFAQIARGNIVEGGKNLLRYATIVPLMGATVDEVKDMVMGRKFRVDEIPDNYIDNLFKVFAISEYAREKSLEQGKLGTFARDAFTPAIVQQVDRLGSDALKIMKGEVESTNDIESIRQLPGAGTMYYNFFGGGLEKFEQEEIRKFKNFEK